MAGYSEEHGQVYPSCFSTSPNQMDFPGPQNIHMELSMASIQQKDFQQPCVKEQVIAPAACDHRSAQTAQPKNGSDQPQAADITVCQRRKRTVYNQAQFDTLERYFKTNMYPDIHHREQLAKQMCLPESRIQVWFQNRRAKARRKGFKHTNPLAVEEHYSNMQGDKKYMYPAAPSPHLSMVQQQQMVTPQQQMEPPRNTPQDMFHQAPEFLSYPQYSCSVPRERLTMDQSSSRVYHQDMPSNILMENQQHFYNNMTPIMAYNNQSMDPSREPMQMPNCSMDYTNFSPNKAISSEMSENIPPISVSTASGSCTRLNSQVPFQMAAAMRYLCKQTSPISDSGVSDRSTEFGSDWDEDITSVLNSL